MEADTSVLSGREAVVAGRTAQLCGSLPGAICLTHTSMVARLLASVRPQVCQSKCPGESAPLVLQCTILLITTHVNVCVITLRVTAISCPSGTRLTWQRRYTPHFAFRTTTTFTRLTVRLKLATNNIYLKTKPKLPLAPLRCAAFPRGRKSSSWRVLDMIT